MRMTLAAAAILLAGAGAGWAQTPGGSCGDVINNPAATCPSVMAPSAGGSFNSGTASSGGSGGPVIDNEVTGSIIEDDTPNPTLPSVGASREMPPLEVPIDPLGQNVGQNPYGGGNQIGIPRTAPFGNNGIGLSSGGITSPSIK
ncbi:hypothetical protein ACSBOB_16905 [Mesorhizobium sp. ASY16-5R]|uniref:hypothetical protein n=1 Tax=Mesorhizobium sp. ASY16-5R TaxID=3445772 RepID=UPI003FA0128D